jgi:hypothetical protein
MIMDGWLVRAARASKPLHALIVVLRTGTGLPSIAST